MYPRLPMTDHPWLPSYDAHVPATLAPYPKTTLIETLASTLALRPDAPCIVFKGRTLSWRDLADESDATALALASLGVRRGDRVAVLLPNCPQFLIVEFAVWKLGATLVPLNPIYSADELAGPLESTRPRLIVTLSTFYERVKEVQRTVPLERVILTSIKEWLPFHLRLAFTLLAEKKGGHRPVARDGDPWLPALVARQRGQRPDPALAATPDDDAMLLMSGGTTGTPKAVRVHHAAMTITGAQVRAWLGAVLPEWEASFCLPLPLFHSFGAIAVQAACFAGRNPIALIPNPRDMDDLVKTIERTKPSVFAGVPTLYNALLEHPRVKAGRVDFRSMKICASSAAPMMAETHRRFREATGARIIEGYALTESLIAATIWPMNGPEKIGSVGTPLPDVIVKIVDADDPTRTLPPGDVGEILLHGPQIMRGYYNVPDGTDQMVHTAADGRTWLHTADLGYLDADGYLFIVDRKKDLIKMGGMQVWPREIEEVLAKHPDVHEVGVRGFPDVQRGEIAVAFVVPRAGARADAAALRAFCKEHLAPYKVPARVVFKTELPKSLIGKVLRRLLTEDAAAS